MLWIFATRHRIPSFSVKSRHPPRSSWVSLLTEIQLSEACGLSPEAQSLEKSSRNRHNGCRRAAYGRPVSLRRPGKEDGVQLFIYTLSTKKFWVWSRRRCPGLQGVQRRPLPTGPNMPRASSYARARNDNVNECLRNCTFRDARIISMQAFSQGPMQERLQVRISARVQSATDAGLPVLPAYRVLPQRRRLPISPRP